MVIILHRLTLVLVLGEGPTWSTDCVGSAGKKILLTLVKKRQNFVWVCIKKVLTVNCMQMK